MVEIMLDRNLNSNSGFTMVELLVVVLIIGMLAAITLPMIIGQRMKGQDVDAKANARNLAGELESCQTTYDRYDHASCLAPAGTGLPLGAAGGQVEVVAAGTTATTFEIVGHSRSGSNFRFANLGSQVVERTCTTASGADAGGCRGNAW